MSIRNMLDSIFSGKLNESTDAFKNIIAEKVQDKLDEIKVDIASSMCVENVEDLDENLLKGNIPTSWNIYRRHRDGPVLVSSGRKKKPSSTTIDRLDNQYGAYVHYSEPVYHADKIKEDVESLDEDPYTNYIQKATTDTNYNLASKSPVYAKPSLNTDVVKHHENLKRALKKVTQVSYKHEPTHHHTHTDFHEDLEYTELDEYAKGQDIGKPNIGPDTGFKNLANKAAKEYGSKKAGNRVAGAILQKILAKKHK